MAGCDVGLWFDESSKLSLFVDFARDVRNVSLISQQMFLYCACFVPFRIDY